MNKFITYGCNKFDHSKKRITQQAIECGWFDSVKAFNPSHLDSEFKNEFKTTLNNAKGGGFWLWKLHILDRVLGDLNDGDIVVYCDAGCSINIHGERRFNEYKEMVGDSKIGMLSFQTPRPEKLVTTYNIFEAFGVEENDMIRETGQLLAGIIILKKTQYSIDMLNHCLDVFKSDNNLITDYYSNKGQIKNFTLNRHDQSLLSVARKLHKSILIPDETWVPGIMKNPKAKEFPLWMSRIRK
jgi:hypothetical protein